MIESIENGIQLVTTGICTPVWRATSAATAAAISAPSSASAAAG